MNLAAHATSTSKVPGLFGAPPSSMARKGAHGSAARLWGSCARRDAMWLLRGRAARLRRAPLRAAMPLRRWAAASRNVV
eukprot:9472723-Pyramimonas_sp.AAC.1